jgi:hypothetical protein
MHDQLIDIYNYAQTLYYTYQDNMTLHMGDIPIYVKPALKHITFVIKF